MAHPLELHGVAGTVAEPLLFLANVVVDVIDCDLAAAECRSNVWTDGTDR